MIDWQNVVTNPLWSPKDLALTYSLYHFSALSGKEVGVVYTRDGRRVRLFVDDEPATPFMSTRSLIRDLQERIRALRHSLNE